MTKPLRDLFSKKNQWTWGHAQKLAFSGDTSSYGLGAVLLQTQTNGERRPVAYMSRSMTPTESRYTQIKRLWLWRGPVSDLIGLQFEIETDHKPFSTIIQFKTSGWTSQFDFNVSECEWCDSTSVSAMYQERNQCACSSHDTSSPSNRKPLEEIRRQKEDEVCKQIVREGGPVLAKFRNL